MKPIYKNLALVAKTLSISLSLNAETRDDENTSTMALQADLLDSLRVELVALNVSGVRDLVASGECVIDGSNLTITLNTSGWTRGAMYRVQVLATFGTQTQVIYALHVTVPYYVALSDETQELEDNVTIVSTITDVTESDLEGLALEATSQEIKAAITPISEAAEAYNVGKTQLAAAITSKGVETSPTESYPEMAEKVNAISQETYEINGGEMYAKQLFGSLETPNYWDLYDILAQLLSDGRLVSYGGILLAEYYRGYDSLALSGAGAGGAYVVSDKDEQGNFKIYTEDTTHVWDTEFDGKGNRWVAYCFADEYHDFQITDTNTSPRSIFIGRKVGNINCLINTRVSQIVIPDGNKLLRFNGGTYSHNLPQAFVIKNVRSISIGISSAVEKLYISSDMANPIAAGGNSLKSIILDFNNNSQVSGQIISTPGVYDNFNNCSTLIICNCDEIDTLSTYGGVISKFCRVDSELIVKNVKRIVSSVAPKYEHALLGLTSFKRVLLIDVEEIDCALIFSTSAVYFDSLEYLYIGYSENDKSRSIYINQKLKITNLSDIELKDGYCKNLSIASATDALTEENMYAHILQRLKQDEPDCGDGVTITLGSTNLAKLTSEESVQLLDDLTNIYGYTFA